MNSNTSSIAYNPTFMPQTQMVAPNVMRINLCHHVPVPFPSVPPQIMYNMEMMRYQAYIDQKQHAHAFFTAQYNAWINFQAQQVRNNEILNDSPCSTSPTCSTVPSSGSSGYQSGSTSPQMFSEAGFDPNVNVEHHVQQHNHVYPEWSTATIHIHQPFSNSPRPSESRLPIFIDLQKKGQHEQHKFSSISGQELVNHLENIHNGDIKGLARRYKTTLCENFETGRCKYNEMCYYAHGHGQLRQVPQPIWYKTNRCKVLDQRGYCKFGDGCFNIH